MANEISQDLIDKCERVIDLKASKVFYQVRSRTDDTKDPYRVEWNAEHRKLTCTCKAGQEGWSCWHMKASLLAEQEYRAFKKAEKQAQARIEATPEYRVERAIVDVEWAKEQAAAAKREARAVKRDKALAYQSRPFSLLK